MIRKGGWIFLILVLLLSTIFPVPDSNVASDFNLSINQVESKLPDVTLFVRLENVDIDRAKLETNLRIKINDTPTKITDIQSVINENGVTENTAYLVLVDTSVSMQSQLSELQILLENLLGYGRPNDKIAVFGVSNTLETLKDFMVTDSSENVTNIVSAISFGSETYLYSGVREAYDKGRKAIGIPTRRIVVLITDGGVDGDCVSSDDLKIYMEVDRLPVYTLILNSQRAVDEEFKSAADQIAQTTGGQSFISTSGNELFAQFKTSNEQCYVIKLRCDNLYFKAFNLQAVMNVTLKRDQGEIRQAAKFTAEPAPIDREQFSQAVDNNKQKLRTSYFGVAVILIPMMVSLFIFLALLWRLLKNKGSR